MPRRYCCFGIRVCVCVRAWWWWWRWLSPFHIVLALILYWLASPLAAGIIVTHWFRLAILCGYRIIEFHCYSIYWTCVSAVFFFISRSGVPTISRSRIIYVRIDESTSSPAFRRVRVCLFWQRAPILICLYFQFLYGCNRLPLIPWDLLRNIQTRHVRSHVCSKIELKKTNKRVGKL